MNHVNRSSLILSFSKANLLVRIAVKRLILPWFDAKKPSIISNPKAPETYTNAARMRPFLNSFG